MRKVKIFSALLAALTLLFLVACGGESETPDGGAGNADNNIQTHNHTPEAPVQENYTSASCTEGAHYDSVVYCADCGVELERNKFTVSDPLGHTPGNVVEENRVEVTCTEDGGYDNVVYCNTCGDELSRTNKTVTKLGHTPKSAIEENRVEATCTEDGGYDNVVYCNTCNTELSRIRETITKLGHTPNSSVEENRVDPTACIDGRYDNVIYCKICHAELSRVEKTIPASHNYEGSKCSDCGNMIYTREGDKILFGTYPQSKVTDDALKAELTAKAGTLPTSINSGKWMSYEYYKNGVASDDMWYIDVEHGAEKYRGIYFTSYRNDNQDDNGYYIRTAYWFKYEPISWTVLKESNGTATILCDMIIDAHQYNYENKTGSDNYAESAIRAWLNETFLNTAFNAFEQKIIETTHVDNSASSTADNSNSYAYDDTNDKIFLLSYKEAINSEYGFSLNYNNWDEARRRKPSDYAQSKGVYVNTKLTGIGNGDWWLRSPYGYYVNYGYFSYRVGWEGAVTRAATVNSTGGIVPALQIKL